MVDTRGIGMLFFYYAIVCICTTLYRSGLVIVAGLFGVLVGLQWYGMNEMERVGKITKQYRFGARVFEPEMNLFKLTLVYAVCCGFMVESMYSHF